MMISILAMLACGPAEDVRPVGPPIQAQLVVHVDPLVRGASGECQSEGLTRCGTLNGPAFLRRSRNFQWLVERWQREGRTMDLQVGPEMALAWSNDASVIQDLAEELEPGEAEQAARLALSTLGDAVRAGTVGLGVHAHTQRRDASGRWGDLDVPAVSEPCVHLDEPPGGFEVAEEAVWAVQTMAGRVNAPLETYGSHLPRTPSGLVELATQYGMHSLGAGMSECFSHLYDHPIYERFSAGEGPYGVGDSLPVTPGVRVVGSMAKHLGVVQDGSAAASRRRLVQLLLNWRHTVLSGEGQRSWVYTFHTHLFDLMDGEPEPTEPSDRQRDATHGQRFRGDLEELASTVDEFSDWDGFMGARSSTGSLVEWTTSADLADPGEDNPASYEPYPYLPVPAMLARSHMVCSASSHGVWMAGFERCEAGWSWGGESGGYQCADGQTPEWLGVIIPDEEGCKPIPNAGTFGWPIDSMNPGEDGYPLHADYECWSGLFVPKSGLLVETDERSLLPSFCMNG